MLTPRQSLYAKGSAGDPLPKVWNSVPLFLRGQLCLICAAPGVGKSALILAYAVKAKIPTFYFSADSDPFVMLTRMLSIQLGWSMERSAAAVRAQQLGQHQFGDLIRFNYETSPSLKTISNSLDSYDEVYGDFPALIVVDNVTNVLTDLNGEDPFAGLEVLMEQLHGLARLTGACVVGLHHVTGEYNNGVTVIPLSGIKGQIARVPEMVLTLHRGGSDRLRVSTVKNRAAKGDPSGAGWSELLFRGDSMTIVDA